MGAREVTQQLKVLDALAKHLDSVWGTLMWGGITAFCNYSSRGI